MSTNQYTVNAIRQQIESLQRTIKNLEELVDRIDLEDDEETISVETVAPEPRRRPTFLGVYDSEGQEIHVGVTVNFLSRRKFTLKTDEFYKVSDNLERVTARDNKKRSISRAPGNLKVVGVTFLRV